METPGRYDVPRVKGQFDGDEERKQHGITVTDTAWDGLGRLAQQFGMKSRSDVIDAVGRGELIRVEDLEAAMEEVIAQLPKANREPAQKWLELLRQQLGLP